MLPTSSDRSVVDPARGTTVVLAVLAAGWCAVVGRGGWAAGFAAALAVAELVARPGGWRLLKALAGLLLGAALLGFLLLSNGARPDLAVRVAGLLAGLAGLAWFGMMVTVALTATDEPSPLVVHLLAGLLVGVVLFVTAVNVLGRLFPFPAAALIAWLAGLAAGWRLVRLPVVAARWRALRQAVPAERGLLVLTVGLGAFLLAANGWNRGQNHWAQYFPLAFTIAHEGLPAMNRLDEPALDREIGAGYLASLRGAERRFPPYFPSQIRQYLYPLNAPYPAHHGGEILAGALYAWLRLDFRVMFTILTAFLKLSGLGLAYLMAQRLFSSRTIALLAGLTFLFGTGFYLDGYPLPALAESGFGGVRGFFQLRCEPAFTADYLAGSASQRLFFLRGILSQFGTSLGGIQYLDTVIGYQIPLLLGFGFLAGFRRWTPARILALVALAAPALVFAEENLLALVIIPVVFLGLERPSRRGWRIAAAAGAGFLVLLMVQGGWLDSLLARSPGTPLHMGPRWPTRWGFYPGNLRILVGPFNRPLTFLTVLLNEGGLAFVAFLVLFPLGLVRWRKLPAPLGAANAALGLLALTALAITVVVGMKADGAWPMIRDECQRFAGYGFVTINLYAGIALGWLLTAAATPVRRAAVWSLLGLALLTPVTRLLMQVGYERWQ